MDTCNRHRKFTEVPRDRQTHMPHTQTTYDGSGDLNNPFMKVLLSYLVISIFPGFSSMV